MKRFSKLLLAVVAISLVAGVAQAQSFGGSGAASREGKWDIYGGLRFLFSESVDFKGGSSIDTDDDLGFAFGFGYNLDEHWLLGGEMQWNNVDYDGTVVSADSPGSTSRLSGALDTFALSGSATYHFMQGPLTPYVSGTLGYTWIDTNIATGPPQVGCWWDPWWGYICEDFQDTKNEESFSYGLGVGVRWDFSRGWFTRLSYEERWLDIGNANGSPTFGGLRLDIGSQF